MIFLIQKRRKTQEDEKRTSKGVDNDETQDKAQLHANSLLPAQELHGNGFSGHELPPVHRTEMAVPEPIGHELPSRELMRAELVVLEPTGAELPAT